MNPVSLRPAISLLAAALGWCGTHASPGQSYAIEPVGFLSASGTSAGAGFTVSGSFSALAESASSQGTFVLTGTLRTVTGNGAPPPPPIGEALANGGFEQTSGAFAPDERGVMFLAGAQGNLLLYGDAEGLAASDGSVPVTLPGWTVENSLAVVAWDTPGVNWISSKAPGPDDRGLQLFYGGRENAVSRARTRIAFPAPPELLDAGTLKAELSGWFGGFLGQGDTSSLALTFLDAAGAELGNVQIGDVTPAERSFFTGVRYRSATRTLPTGTREAEVVLEMKREADNGWNDALADNLSLVLRYDAPSALPGWSVLQPGVLWVTNQNTLGATTPHGQMFVDLAGSRVEPPFGGLAQTLPTLAGRRYRLHFDLGTRHNPPGLAEPIAIELVVNSATHTFGFQPDGDGDEWRSFSHDFTALGTAMRVAWIGRSTGGGAYLGLDRLSLEIDPPTDAPVLDVAASLNPASPSSLELSFPSEAGATYSLQALDDLGTIDWSIVPGSERAGTGGRLSLTLPMTPGKAVQFFRLRMAR